MQKRVIAVCGKGGVGKTAFTTLLTKVITEDQSAGKLLVVDADPALGLHYALGRGSIKTIGTVRDEILRVAEEGNRQAQEELADRVDYLTAQVLDEGKDFSFLAMGHMDSKGCFCSVNDLLKGAIGYLTGEFDTILI
ncbi:ArsA-related P-loop ATPase, partial [uncultured Parasutterella sp.]